MNRDGAFSRRAVLMTAFVPRCCDTEEAPAESVRWEQDVAVIDVAKAPALKPKGGSVKLIDEGRGVRVLVARLKDGSYAAWERECTHGGAPLTYNERHQTALCTSLGHSEFEVDGSVRRGPAPRPLKTYVVKRAGTLLKIVLLTASLAFGQGMGKTEVTVEEFGAFVKATGHVTAAEKAGDARTWRSPGFRVEKRQPVVYVSIDDAEAYCKWAGGHLPSEEEWAKAAGAAVELDERTTWYRENAEGRPRAVGTKQPNEAGLFDMQGNVWEWARTSEGRPAMRGGSWMSCPQISPWAKEKPLTRVVITRKLDARDDDVGFRCVGAGGVR